MLASTISHAAHGGMLTSAYSYIRFSHPDQRRGNSLRRQLGRSQRYADAKGLRLDDTIQDLARSAFHNRHTVTGNLGGFLALVREGKIARGSYLLIESFDRLSRDEFWPAFNLISEIFAARIHITTLPDDDEVHEYSYESINKNPNLIHEVINDLTRGHGEAKIKSSRCRDACASQREDARAGIAKIPGRCPAWLIPVRGTIMVEVDGEMREKNATIAFEQKSDLVKVVRLIFEWTIQGMGMGAIVSRLNREGNPKFGKTGWHKRTVAELLHNREVVGFKQPRKMVDGISVTDGLPEIKDHYPEIIKRDVFYAAQGAIKSRHTGASGRTGDTYPNLLRGIAQCTECGKPLHYVSTAVGERNSPSTRYLICSRGKRSLCTNNTHYLYVQLEEELLTILPLIDFSRLVSHPNSDAARGEILAAQITEKSERLTALARRKVSPEIETVMDELTDELVALRRDLATFNENARIIEAQTNRDSYDEFLRLLDRLNDPALSADDLKLIRCRIAAELRRLIEVAVAEGDTITIKFKKAAHQRVELRIVDSVVERLDLWSRDMMHPDYPNNPMRIAVSFDRAVLLNPENELVGMFGQFVAA